MRNLPFVLTRWHVERERRLVTVGMNVLGPPWWILRGHYGAPASPSRRDTVRGVDFGVVADLNREHARNERSLSGDGGSLKG